MKTNKNEIATLLFKQNKVVFIIQTVIPFIIPFIFEIPSSLLSIWIKIPLFIIVAYIDLKLIFLIEQKIIMKQSKVFIIRLLAMHIQMLMS